MLRQAFRVASLAGVPAFVVGCHTRAAAPERPDALRPGTFVLALRGSLPLYALGRPPRVHTFDETVTGTACRVGEYLRLDGRRRGHRMLVQLPRIGPAHAAYALELAPLGGAPWNPGAAHAHLNLASRLNGGASLPLVGGSVAVTAPTPAEVLGTIDARVVQRVAPDSAAPEGFTRQGATLRGVFRADRCDDWPAEAAARRAP